jgi:hypothetical protein
MPHLLRQLILIGLSTLFYCSSLGQGGKNKQSQYIDPPGKNFSQMEVKLFYGKSKISNDYTGMSSYGTNYYQKLDKGNELTLELTTQVYKHLFASFYYSSLNTESSSGALIIRLENGGALALMNEAFTFTRTGISFNVQKQFKKTKNPRWNISFGLVETSIKNEMTLRGRDGLFDLTVKDKSPVHPFITIGISSLFIIPQIQLHVRYTRHFGRYGNLQTDDKSFTRTYGSFDFASLKQRSIQIGISYLVNSKIGN